MFEICNYIESGVWSVIGLIFVGCAIRRSGEAGRLCWIAVATFVLLGISDIVEVETGAWCRPWRLLVWKAVCVASMAHLLIARARQGRRDAAAAISEQDAA